MGSSSRVWEGDTRVEDMLLRLGEGSREGLAERVGGFDGERPSPLLLVTGYSVRAPGLSVDSLHL